DEISGAIADGDLVVCSVLSGNRNFEARIHPEVKANYLASPPLVVAYSLAGRLAIDFRREPLGTPAAAETFFLADLGPSAGEVGDAIASSVRAEQFAETYADVFTGDEAWRSLPVPEGDLFAWTRRRRTSGYRPTSTGCHPSPASSRTLRARACSSGSATR